MRDFLTFVLIVGGASFALTYFFVINPEALMNFGEWLQTLFEY
jgi:hypothetical protein